MDTGFILSLLLAWISCVQLRTDDLKKNDLDIYSFHIKSEVTSRYAMTVITSRVANRVNESRAVDFHVELPKNAFISKFTLTIDGHTYNGVVKQNEEALQQYSQAVSKGQSAGLVSVVGRKVEEFKTSVTVAALSKLTFELTYEELLKRKLGKYELLIKAKPTQVVKDFKIDVHIYEQQGISFLDTQGALAKLVNTTLSDKEARVQFSPTKQQQQQCSGCGPTGLSGDLIVTYDVNRAKSTGAIQVSQGYFVHYFAPTDLPRIPKNVVFIIDQSGSMQGRKIQQTRQALLKILESIPDEDHFNLITFNHKVKSWKNNLVPATSENLAAARSFTKEIYDGGSTDINIALLEGVRKLDQFSQTQPHEGHISILILLTDGDPTSGVTNMDTIQANVKEAIRRRYKLYCLGFGFDVNYQFLEKIALENGGIARRIYPDSDADLQLQGFYEEVAIPLLLDIQVNYSGASNLTQTSFGTYYNGSEIVVAGRVVDQDLEVLAVEIKAWSKDDEMVLPKEKMKTEMMDTYIFQMYIQRLWAYLTVQQLLEREVLLTGDEKAAVRKQALDLSLKYSFVTPLTSMVVTKPEKEETQVVQKPKEDKPQSEARTSHAGMMLHAQVAQRSISRIIEPYHASRHYAFSPQQGRAFISAGSAETGEFIHQRAKAVKIPQRHKPEVTMEIPAKARPTEGTGVAMDPVPIAQTTQRPGTRSLRFLLPAPGGKTPLCFDVTLSQEPIFKLLEDPETGVSLKAKVGSVAGKDFDSISIRYKDDLHIAVGTRWVIVTHGQEKEAFSWVHASTSYQSQGVSVLLKEGVLEVAVGETCIEVFLHQLGQERFLWPVIRQTPPESLAIGIMGKSLVSYEEKQGSPSAILEIDGKEVEVVRESANDFSNFSVPIVDCWLLPYQSILHGDLSDVTES